MCVYERLEALNIALPKLTPQVAAYVPFLRSGNLIFLAGHIAKRNGQPWVGQSLPVISTLTALISVCQTHDAKIETALVANIAMSFAPRGANG